MNKLVSILMPAKNAAPFLKDCIDSIRAQTYTQWELIVVDDHSTDDTAYLLKEYSELDIRIQSISNQGNGIINALRLAYTHSTGDYITRMDADDIMPSSKIALLLDACNTDKVLSTGLVEYFSEDTLGDGYLKYAAWLNQNLLSKNPFQDIYKECVIPSPCWMMHRTTLDSIGAFDKDTYPEDYDLCFRAYAHSLGVNTVGSVLHRWRDHPIRSSRTHEHYSDNRFLDLKVSYFLKLDHRTEIPLYLWGAGKKGKTIAKLLNQYKVPFHWISDNAKKIGHEIYDVIVEDERVLEKLNYAQILIAIAGAEDQVEVNKRLEDRENLKGYWFC